MLGWEYEGDAWGIRLAHSETGGQDRPDTPVVDWWPQSWDGFIPADDANADVELGLPTDPKCGPDVTDWLVSQLMQLLIITSPGGRLLFVRGQGPIDVRSQTKGLPNKPQAKTVDCPVDCPESVTLCGECLHDQIPGNIGLGAAVDPWSALKLGAAVAAFKGETDSEEDKQSYDVGDTIRDETRLMRDRNRYSMWWNIGDAKVAAAVKKSLCAAVGGKVASGAYSKRTSSDGKVCPKCTSPWSR